MWKKAVPVYAENLKNKMNTHIMLSQSISSLEGCSIKISAASFYKLYVNDVFVGFGPARTAKGYARVDCFDLTPYNKKSGNEIKIEVVGYACSSYYVPRQPSFVICEVAREEEVLLYTGRDFSCYVLNEYIAQTRRFSGQRCFTEVRDFGLGTSCVPMEEVEAPAWLERVVPYPLYKETFANKVLSGGKFSYDPTIDVSAWKFDGGDKEKWGYFNEDNLDYSPFTYVKSLKQTKTFDCAPLPLRLCGGEYAIIDLKKIEVGFIKLLIKAKKNSDIIIAFSEYLTSDTFAFGKIDCENVLEYILPEGKHNTESFDVYTFRYLAVFVKSGEIELNSAGVKAYEFNTDNIFKPNLKDKKLDAVYNAAVRTLAHNAVDLYTDCPSRERAGWLCDSYFTAKAEYFLTGKCLVEEAFLENYRLYENEGDLPKGALPMCYPADIPISAKFIPQWNMWYVLEVCEFLNQRSPDFDKELFRESVMGIIKFLAEYENEDGLLEDLPEWNFVEWTKANEWVLNVNYPTNFLYSAVLDAAYSLYGDAALKEKAQRVRETAKRLSFNGEVFTDNAVRDENGQLLNTGNISEAAQYYAVLFGKADTQSPDYKALKEHILDGFKQFEKSQSPDKYTSVNAFIGFYLRMMVLLNMGEKELLMRDIKDFFYDMAKTTGTLWEYKEGLGSRDHGFASFVAYIINEAIK